MDIQLEKYKLMEWLVNLKDVFILNPIKKIKENPIDKSEWSDGCFKNRKSINKC
ncbi:MAG: hypothetical protein L3J23_04510 [Flavobacteriaceae bacterium]|nr:hypothetical protein [Flavobacteriaceae bacterium]